MQKTYCDMCAKEIVSGDLTGGLMQTIERFPMINVPGGFPGEPQKMNPIVQKQIQTQVWDLCPDCKKAMWDIAEKKQKDFKEKKKEFDKIVPKSTLIKS